MFMKVDNEKDIFQELYEIYSEKDVVSKRE